MSGPVDVLTETSPPRIWLQVYQFGTSRNTPYPEADQEIVWSDEPTGRVEVEYVRAADMAELIELARKLADNDFTFGSNSAWIDARNFRAALARVGGAS